MLFLLKKLHKLVTDLRLVKVIYHCDKCGATLPTERETCVPHPKVLNGVLAEAWVKPCACQNKEEKEEQTCSNCVYFPLPDDHEICEECNGPRATEDCNWEPQKDSTGNHARLCELCIYQYKGLTLAEDHCLTCKPTKEWGATGFERKDCPNCGANTEYRSANCQECLIQFKAGDRAGHWVPSEQEEEKKAPVYPVYNGPPRNSYCDDCRHCLCLWDVMPCKKCTKCAGEIAGNACYFDPKEEKKSCGNCFYRNVPEHLEPCASCDISLEMQETINWEIASNVVLCRDCKVNADHRMGDAIPSSCLRCKPREEHLATGFIFMKDLKSS